MFKIKFQLSEVSQFNPRFLIDKTVSYLIKQEYLIEKKTNDVVFFKDNNWQIRSKGTGFRKVDNGLFEMKSVNEGAMIIYTYYNSFLPELILTSIILTISVIQSFMVLFIAIPLLLQFLLRIYTLKKVSQQIVKHLAN